MNSTAAKYNKLQLNEGLSRAHGEGSAVYIFCFQVGRQRLEGTIDNHAVNTNCKPSSLVFSGRRRART
jgi:hypothetical protein